MLITNPFYGAFGLDFGDSSIKLVQIIKKFTLRGRSTFELKHLRKVDLLPGCIAQGEILQSEAVKQKVLHLLGYEGNEFKKISSSWVVFNLPVTKTFLKLIEIKTLPTQLTEEDVKLEAVKHMPFDIKETYLDWQIVNKDCEGAASSWVLIGVAPKLIVDAYFNLLDSIGLSPIAVELEDLSIARAMVTGTKTYMGEARAILDLGASRSTIIIYDKGSIQFSQVINFSGELLNTALMQALKIDRGTAEALKNKNGLTYDPTYPVYLKTVSEITDRLLFDITKAITYYNNHFSEPNPVTHITMSGGTSAFKNLDKIITKKLAVGAYPGNAWKNIYNEKLIGRDRLELLSFASAVGLGLRAAEEPKNFKH
jgi:type IV pilus assembly protein PilM